MRDPTRARVPDGQRWSAEADQQASEDVLACFLAPAGKRTLDYLRKITTGRVLGPTASAAELRDLEGRRALVAIIDMRMADARDRREQSGRWSAPGPDAVPAADA